MLKGGVAAGIIVKRRLVKLGKDWSHVYDLFQRGDNDVGIYIDPTLSKEEFKFIFDVISNIVETVMLENKRMFSSEGELGKIILESANYAMLPNGCKLASGRDVYLTRKDWRTVERSFGGEECNVRYSCNDHISFIATDNAHNVFSLHRLKMMFNVDGEVCSGEILDIAISKREDTSLCKTFAVWRDNTVSIATLS
jgi:hypothetical protein